MQLKFGNPTLKISLILAFMLFSLSILAIIVFIAILKRTWKKKEPVRDGFEALTEGLNQKSAVATFWKPIILIRWIITISIYVQLSKNCLMQIAILLTKSVFFQALLLKFKPFDSRTDNMISLFNELMNSAYLYT